MTDLVASHATRAREKKKNTPDDGSLDADRDFPNGRETQSPRLVPKVCLLRALLLAYLAALTNAHTVDGRNPFRAT